MADHAGALWKTTLKYKTLYSLSSFFSSRFSVAILTILALNSSSTRFMIMPTLLISLCLATNSTSSLEESSLPTRATVLSTLTCCTPLNLDYSKTGVSSLLRDIDQVIKSNNILVNIHKESRGSLGSCIFIECCLGRIGVAIMRQSPSLKNISSPCGILNQSNLHKNKR